MTGQDIEIRLGCNDAGSHDRHEVLRVNVHYVSTDYGVKVRSATSGGQPVTLPIEVSCELCNRKFRIGKGMLKKLIPHVSELPDVVNMTGFA